METYEISVLDSPEMLEDFTGEAGVHHPDALAVVNVKIPLAYAAACVYLIGKVIEDLGGPEEASRRSCELMRLGSDAYGLVAIASAVDFANSIGLIIRQEEELAS